MTYTIITIYRRDVPVARAQWSARYETTAAGMRQTLRQLERYIDATYVWYVTTITI